jgi:translation initiation factor IF-3
VRLIGANGEQLGILSLPRALDLARNANLDLVEVSPTAQPPVARLLDYGKFKYEQTRKEREARKSQKTQTLKEMRFKASIADHDIDYRTKLIKNFLTEGDKVKVTVTFRGRQNAHPEIGRQVLDEIVSRLDGTGSVERAPLLEGRAMTMILSPTPQKANKQSPSKPATPTAPAPAQMAPAREGAVR